MFNLSDLIDSYIELGYDYDDAYEMAMDDLRRGFKFDTTEDEQQAQAEQERQEYAISQESMSEDDERLVRQGMKRGFALNEAKGLVILLRKYQAAGNTTKMFKIISQLKG